jgi:hypothetical protein
MDVAGVLDNRIACRYVDNSNVTEFLMVGRPRQGAINDHINVHVTVQNCHMHC